MNAEPLTTVDVIVGALTLLVAGMMIATTLRRLTSAWHVERNRVAVLTRLPAGNAAGPRFASPLYVIVAAVIVWIALAYVTNDLRAPMRLALAGLLLIGLIGAGRAAIRQR